MPEYKANIIVKGNLRQTVIIADDEVTARRQAKRQGRVVRLKKRNPLLQFFEPRMRPDERIVFLQRLGMMIRSRLGMSDALKVMRSAFSGSVRRVADELLRRVEQGADFGEAVFKMSKDFPNTTAALINSGIQGGNLPQALDNAASFELEMDEIRRSSSRGMAGALFTFFTAAALTIGTAFFVGPWMLDSQLMQQAGDAIDIDWAYYTAYVLASLMIVMVVGVGGLLSLTYLVKPVAPGFSDRIVLKIPIYRDLVLAKNNYTVLHGLGLLIESGVRMEDALRLAAESAPRGEVRADLERAYRAIRTGSPWASVMNTLHPTDIAALSTAQNKEQIANAFQAVAGQFRKTYVQRVQDVVPGMQLLSALFMSIAGGLLFALIILPMLQLTQALI